MLREAITGAQAGFEYDIDSCGCENPNFQVHYLYLAMHHSGSTYCLSQVALQKENQFDENEITQEIDRMNKLSHTVSLLITARLVDANGRIVCLSFTRSLNILRLELYIFGQ